jgi:hypothetical protein
VCFAASHGIAVATAAAVVAVRMVGAAVACFVADQGTAVGKPAEAVWGCFSASHGIAVAAAAAADVAEDAVGNVLASHGMAVVAAVAAVVALVAGSLAARQGIAVTAAASTVGAGADCCFAASHGMEGPPVVARATYPGFGVANVIRVPSEEPARKPPCVATGEGAALRAGEESARAGGFIAGAGAEVELEADSGGFGEKEGTDADADAKNADNLDITWIRMNVSAHIPPSYFRHLFIPSNAQRPWSNTRSSLSTC